MKKDTMSEEGSVGLNEENQRPRKQQKKGGKPNRFEPIRTEELIAFPCILSHFQDLRCYEFCNKVQEIKSHPQLTNLFASRLHRHKVHLAGVRFELTTSAISKATGMHCIGER